MFPKHWNAPFEERFGKLLEAEILNWKPNSHVGAEKDYFYYKFGILEALIDHNKFLPSPTESMLADMNEYPLCEHDFEEFCELALDIRRHQPATVELLSDAIILKCNEVIDNFKLVSALLKFESGTEH